MATEYLKIRWLHELPEEPIVLLSEVQEGWEVRKVEIFRNGRLQRAGPDGATGDTRLSETRIPGAEEIAADPQFTVEPTTAAEFEAAWRAAGGT